MKHLEESHKHLEDEQDMDNILEKEFQEKQEMEERRELCLALQLDSECIQPHFRPLTKVLSLPSNFTYNPPGSKRNGDKQPLNQQRRQTLHSQQPIMLTDFDDIKNIDESVSDIYNVCSKNDLTEKNRKIQNTNLDDIITVAQSETLLKVSDCQERYGMKKSYEIKGSNFLSVPVEQKPLQKLYGSTKHLFCRQKSIDTAEETPFLLSTNSLSVPREKSHGGGEEAKIPKHDSTESVQRVILERRKLDENLKEINQYDIFDTKNSSEENILEKDNEEEKNKDDCVKKEED